MKSPNCGVEGSHSPNEQDPRYNEHGFRGKIFWKNHCWFSVRQRPAEFTPDLPIKNCPNPPGCTLLSAKLHHNSKICDHFHLHSSFSIKTFVLICCFLFLFIYSNNLWASISVKQVDDASSIYAITQREWMHLWKATGSSFLHFKGRCTITEGGPKKFPPPRWHIRGSWQLFKYVSILNQILHLLDCTPHGFWQPTEDDNMSC